MLGGTIHHPSRDGAGGISETQMIRRGVSITSGRTTLGTKCLLRALEHKTSAVGLSSWGQMPMPGKASFSALQHVLAG
jgi:hypothetical protein